MIADAPVTVLLHSPLTGPQAWGGLPDVLRATGQDVVVVDVRDDETRPYASRYVARAALQILDAAGDRRVVLVGHSGAGYLLPMLGAARRAARAPLAAYVFCDAGLPPARPASRLDQLRVELADEPAQVAAMEAHLAAGGRFPDWSDDDLRELVPDDQRRAALVRSLRPRDLDFFTEAVPVAPDWPDAPCGYLRLSGGYVRPMRSARSRGWPVVEGDPAGGHFAMCTDPGAVAALLDELRRQL